MDKKQQLGQYFSKNEELIAAFKGKVGLEDVLVDPFAGALDLLKEFSNQYEAYDIDPIQGVAYNDSFLTPINYSGKFIITNPPYLNKNKTHNKEVFNRYGVDDLYKAALLDIIETGKKGIIILPSGFWFNEANQDIRKRFLMKFRVDKVMVFNKRMFEDTTYTVCSFYFEQATLAPREISFTFLTEVKEYSSTLTFSLQNNYSIQDEVVGTLRTLPKKYKISRYTATTKIEPTNIFLRCIDASDKIQVLWREPFMGISTDRAFLTFVVEGLVLNEEEEKDIIKIFNSELNRLRLLYDSAFLSNYRNDGRKRISFTFAYKLLAHSISLYFNL